MATSDTTRKCARCNHPRNRHMHGPAYGCTVRKYAKGRSGPVPCDCPGFKERGQ